MVSGLFVETGRVKDVEGRRLKTALRQVAEKFPQLEFRLSANQNVILANVAEADRAGINALLAEHGVKTENQASVLQRGGDGLPCPAHLRPGAGGIRAHVARLWLTASKNFAPKSGWPDEEIIIRSTGCPNGCARPYWRRSRSSAKRRAVTRSGSAATWPARA